jgi:hypothetical protein
MLWFAGGGVLGVGAGATFGAALVAPRVGGPGAIGSASANKSLAGVAGTRPRVVDGLISWAHARLTGINAASAKIKPIDSSKYDLMRFDSRAALELLLLSQSASLLLLF